ncbi:MAG: septal ring lytic transglycosylase RlpA family protein [Synechococcaceae cyanobacterium]|nr:septal ring lytic transglycosylase RlpA family protein [Synechococcaceae cyanobacterium]
MRRLQLLAITALLSGGSIGAAQAAAPLASLSPTSIVPATLAIRESGGSSSFEERLQREMPPVPIAQAQIAAAVLPPALLTPAAATPQPRVVRVINGQASWYGPGFFGNRTASGEVFRPGTYTAAHRTLTFGTRVRVHNLSNGRSVVVRINDRGPFHGSRVIDVAHGAARDLGLTASGTAQVRLEVLQ